MRGRFDRSSRGSVSFFAFQDVITGTTGFLIIITIFLALDLHQVVGTGAAAAVPADQAGRLGKVVEEIVALKEKVASKAAPEEDEQTLRRMIEELKLSIARLSLASGPGEMPAEEPELNRELRIERQKLITQVAALEKLVPGAAKGVREASAQVAALEQQVKELQGRLETAEAQKNTIQMVPERTDTSKEPVLLIVRQASLVLMTLDGGKSPELKSFPQVTRALAAHPPARCYVVLYFKPSGALWFDDATKHVRGLGYEIGYDILPEDAEVKLGPAKP